MKKLHSSWQIAATCLGIVIGTGLVAVFKSAFLLNIGYLIVGLVLTIIAATKQRRWLITLALIGGALVGAYRSSTAWTKTTKHSSYQNSAKAPDPGANTRANFSAYIAKAIPGPEATLGSGFLVGDKGALPSDLTTQLQLLGLTHIIVASGYNLTILVRLARRIFARVSKYLAALASTATIGAFIYVAGLSPSMVRAGIVAGLSLLAWYYGRHIHPLVILPVAAAITVLFNPAYGWGDVGWALSFAAFAGVLVLAPLINSYFWATKHQPLLRQVFLETVSAQLATLPIIALVFGQYSPLSLIANLLILPFVPLAMLLTFIAGLAAWLAPAIATIVGWPAWALLHYMTSLSAWLATSPWAQGSVQLTRAELISSYFALVVATVWLWRRTKYTFSQNSLVE